VCLYSYIDAQMTSKFGENKEKEFLSFFC